MKALLKLVNSFGYAFRGIFYCIRFCRNFRIHTVAAALVMFVSALCGFSASEYCIIILTISLTLSLEAINTAIEYLCDITQKEYSDLIKKAKDISAGAVLISALFAVATAFFLFIKSGALVQAVKEYFSDPVSVIILILCALASVIYIFYEDIFKYGKK